MGQIRSSGSMESQPGSPKACLFLMPWVVLVLLLLFLSPSRYSDRLGYPGSLTQQHKPWRSPFHPSRLPPDFQSLLQHAACLCCPSGLISPPPPHNKGQALEGLLLWMWAGEQKNHAFCVPCDTSLSAFDRPGRIGISAPYSRRSSERSRDLLKASQPFQ